MKPIKLKIETKTQKYPIIIGSNLITNFSKIIKNNSLTFNQCLLVVDKSVPKKFVTKIKNVKKRSKKVQKGPEPPKPIFLTKTDWKVYHGPWAHGPIGP